MKTLLFISWITCQGLDIGTTHYALNRPDQYQERNPIIGNSHARLYSFKLSVNVGAYLWHRKRQTVVVPVAMAVTGCVPGILNLKTIRRNREAR